MRSRSGNCLCLLLLGLDFYRAQESGSEYRRGAGNEDEAAMPGYRLSPNIKKTERAEHIHWHIAASAHVQHLKAFEYLLCIVNNKRMITHPTHHSIPSIPHTNKPDLLIRQIPKSKSLIGELRHVKAGVRSHGDDTPLIRQ